MRAQSEPADCNRWMPKRAAWYASNMGELTVARQAVAHRGRRLEYFTIVWNGLEGLVAVAAGIAAGSISLVGFGMDSFIEVTHPTGSGTGKDHQAHQLARVPSHIFYAACRK